jgi:hypothetical protein
MFVNINSITDYNDKYLKLGLCFYDYLKIHIGVIRGRAVNVVDLKPLAPHRCMFESRQGLWIFPCKAVIRLATERRWSYSGTC